MFSSIIECVNANKLTLVAPILFISLLFIGCKLFKKGEWNEEFLSLEQTKMIKGFCTVGIVLHHCSQRTAAAWLPSIYIIHGLDFFVDIGYLFVAVYLFFSGYGLYKSYKNKDNYFKHYFLKRFVPLLLALFFSELIYYLYHHVLSTYTWYVYAILICYALFYIGFKFIKNEHVSLLIVLFGIILYSIYCANHELGGWWYNTIGLFYIGLVFGKYETSIVEIFKKGYVPLLLFSVSLTFVCRYYGLYYEQAVYSVYKKEIVDLYNLLIIVFRFFAGIGFTLLLLLISLKIRFNNKVLLFYESISLEFYLIQGLFAHMFSFLYFDTFKPLYYIKNIPLYTIVVLVCSTISGLVLHIVDSKISKTLFNIVNKKDV